MIRGPKASEKTAMVIVHPSELLGQVDANIADLNRVLANKIDQTYVLPENKTSVCIPPNATIVDPNVFDPEWKLNRDPSQTNIILSGGLVTVCFRRVCNSILENASDDKITFHLVQRAVFHNQSGGALLDSNVEDAAAMFAQDASDIGSSMSTYHNGQKISDDRNSTHSMKFWTDAAKLADSLN